LKDVAKSKPVKLLGADHDLAKAMQDCYLKEFIREVAGPHAAFNAIEQDGGSPHHRREHKEECKIIENLETLKEFKEKLNFFYPHYINQQVTMSDDDRQEKAIVVFEKSIDTSETGVQRQESYPSKIFFCVHDNEFKIRSMVNLPLVANDIRNV